MVPTSQLPKRPVASHNSFPDGADGRLPSYLNKIAGAVVVVARHGKVAYVATVGYRDLAKKTPMTENTIFAIASMSKPITCVAAMMLVEEGKLNLDDPVDKHVPALTNLCALGNAKDDTTETLATVPIQRTMLVRHLFAHTAGFSYGFAMMGTETERRMIRAYSKANLLAGRLKTISELPAELAKLPLAHEPGEGWTYGMSHDVLGRVIEVVSGQPLDQFLNERIFVPLDMTDTSFLVPEPKRDDLYHGESIRRQVDRTAPDFWLRNLFLRWRRPVLDSA
jgi:CubicO group peptidase (beta-lactamase class C family)